MAKKGKGYLNMGLAWILNLILAIIPFTSWILGGITRLQRGHIIAAILQFTIAAPIFWIVDIITMITSKDLTLFA